MFGVNVGTDFAGKQTVTRLTYEFHGEQLEVHHESYFRVRAVWGCSK
jgi:hypothetical protein